MTSSEARCILKWMKDQHQSFYPSINGPDNKPIQLSREKYAELESYVAGLEDASLRLMGALVDKLTAPK
jgi:hypothetical protein